MRSSVSQFLLFSSKPFKVFGRTVYFSQPNFRWYRKLTRFETVDETQPYCEKFPAHQFKYRNIVPDQTPNELEPHLFLSKNLSDEAFYEYFYDTISSSDKLKIAVEFYNVMSIFDDGFFDAQIPLSVEYTPGEETGESSESGKDSTIAVGLGNFVPARQAFHPPSFHFNGKSDTKYTLLMLGLDGNLWGKQEFLHWLVTDITNGNGSEMNVISDYLPIFPACGLGYHRYLFILFEQLGNINIDGDVAAEPHYFNTKAFYHQHKDSIRPVSYSFFTSSWSPFVRLIYHHLLEIPQPMFEYDFPEPLRARQRFTPPENVAFDRYLDDYRDRRDIYFDEMKIALRRSDPRAPPDAQRFPAAAREDEEPVWLRKAFLDGREAKQPHWYREKVVALKERRLRRYERNVFSNRD